MYTTEQASEYLNHRPHKSVEFRNVKWQQLRMFLCDDGIIGLNETGKTEVYVYSKGKFADDTWIMAIKFKAFLCEAKVICVVLILLLVFIWCLLGVYFAKEYINLL